MKIIKQGTPPGDRLWVGVCNRCKSEAVAKELELNDIVYDQRGGLHSWEMCPVCNAGTNGCGGMLFYRKKP